MPSTANALGFSDNPQRPSVRKASQSSTVKDEPAHQHSESVRKVSEDNISAGLHAADRFDNERQLFGTLPENPPDLEQSNSNSSAASTNKPVKAGSLIITKRTPTLPAVRPSRKSVSAIPSKSSASGSVLSTKQRLAMGALTPTIPKAVPKAELNPGKGISAHALKALAPIKKVTREKPILSVSTAVEPSKSVEPTPTSTSYINPSPSLPFQSPVSRQTRTPQTPSQTPLLSNEFVSEP